MRIALVAGELSGDILGGALIEALRRRFPEAHCYGVAGPRMRAAGCEAIESIEALSVMGLAEVLRHLPRLLRLRRMLERRFVADRPDVFVGIDAPDFNLGLARRLRATGIRTVQFVSPTVWAWRQHRVRGIARAVDLMLTLFPFETAIYERHGVPVADVGHPLADELEPGDAVLARRELGLDPQLMTVAVLPGSRSGEIRHLAQPFAEAAAWLQRHRTDLQFVVPVAKPALRRPIEAAIAAAAPGLRWHLVDGRSREAMQAADLVLTASGTAALECLLLERPMVVGYRVSSLTAWLLRAGRLLKIQRVSIPNLLCPQPVVPEFLQEEVRAPLLGGALLTLLENPARREEQTKMFAAARKTLRRNAAQRAAEAIGKLLGR